MFARKPVGHGAAQLVGEDRQRCGFAVLVFKCGKIRFPGLTLADKEDGGFGQRPASVDVADFLARGAQSFAIGFLGALHQTTIGHKIRYAREAGDSLNLIQKDQGQNWSAPWYGLEPRKGLHVVRFGTAREREFHFAEQLIIGVNERHIDFNRFTDTGIGKMVGDLFAIRFVRQPLPNFGEMVLTLGIVNVGEEFRTLAGERTAAPE